MEKIKNYENFEVDEPINNVRESHLFAKIVIVLILIIIFEIIYLLFIRFSSIKEKDKQLSEINGKFYILDDGNKKLDIELKEMYEEDYACAEQLKKIDKERKSKEDQTKNYKKKSQKALKDIPTPDEFEKIKEQNNDKKKKINELKLQLNDKSKKFREKFNTKIIDNLDELNIVKDLIKNNINKNEEINFDVCYSSEENDFNFSEVNDKCKLSDQEKAFLIILQNNLFDRYGVYFDNNKKGSSFVFDLNNKEKKENLFESQWVKLSNEQKQNLILLFNLINELKFENKKKEIDYINYSNITEIEIFNVN